MCIGSLQPSDFNCLNIVHVAGTKGKGSTCTFVNSILSCYQRLHGVPKKIALYTSPHLIAVRERLQIDGEPISEDQFTKYFFEVWNRLERSALKEGHEPTHKPTYFRFLTLMSFHVFIEEGVDIAIYEVGVGGERDSTNIIDRPVATGITSLGIDHVGALGSTIESIAWHKAGIFKFSSPAFTVDQYPAAMDVLEERAKEKSVELIKVGIHPNITSVNLKGTANFQKKNASLAIYLAGAALTALGTPLPDLRETLPDGFIQGLENAVCRGRLESNFEGPTTWYLDGAHTLDSLTVSGEWFSQIIRKELVKSYFLSIIIPTKVLLTSHCMCIPSPDIVGHKKVSYALIFNQQSRPEVLSLLKALHDSFGNTSDGSTYAFDHVVFCTNVTWKDKGYDNGALMSDLVL